MITLKQFLFKSMQIESFKKPLNLNSIHSKKTDAVTFHNGLLTIR